MTGGGRAAALRASARQKSSPTQPSAALARHIGVASARQKADTRKAADLVAQIETERREESRKKEQDNPSEDYHSFFERYAVPLGGDGAPPRDDEEGWDSAVSDTDREAYGDDDDDDAPVRAADVQPKLPACYIPLQLLPAALDALHLCPMPDRLAEFNARVTRRYAGRVYRGKFRRLCRRLRRFPVDRGALAAAFRTLDRENRGYLAPDEFAAALQEGGMTEAESLAVLTAFDKEGHGKITATEFVEAVCRHDPPPPAADARKEKKRATTPRRQTAAATPRSP